MSARLFGTDGIRGRAGEPPLDTRTVRRLGMALVKALPQSPGPIRLLVGRDTRESGERIERDLAVGATAAGATVVSAGVIPTPAVAHLTRSQGFAAGLVISASHNPFHDNGIKVFSGGGEKFTESLEDGVEAIMADASWQEPRRRRPGRADDRRSRRVPRPRAARPRRAVPCPRPADRHRLRERRNLPGGAGVAAGPRVRGHRDCAASPTGATSTSSAGPRIPSAWRGRWSPRAATWAWRSTATATGRSSSMRAGRIVDGDAVLLMCAKQMQAAGRLRGNAVVATVMSNLGLEMALRDLGIGLVRCPVGDKYVMEELLRDNLSLGGEQSGHVIFPDFLYTGDGIVTALNVLRVMAETGRTLADLAGDLQTYPQVLLNLRVREKRDWMTIPAAARAIEERRGEARGARPAPGAVLGHRAAAARHDRRGAPGRDQRLGGTDCRRGQVRDRRMTGVSHGRYRRRQGDQALLPRSPGIPRGLPCQGRAPARLGHAQPAVEDLPSLVRPHGDARR